MTLRTVTSPTPRPPTWLIVVTALWLVGAAAMFGFALPAVTEGCGAPALDTRFGWTSDDAAAFLRACSPDGVAAIWRQQLLDAIYPLVLAATLLGWTRWSLRRLLPLATPRGRVAALTAIVALPAIASTLGDLVENAAVVGLLATGDVVSWLAPAVGAASAVKHVAGAIAMTATLALVVATLARLAARHLQRTRHSSPV